MQFVRAGHPGGGRRVAGLSAGQHAGFADFLIAVEAEMNKVSWPTRAELFRSSMVVIFCILFLAAVLYGYDLFWSTLLHVLRIVGATSVRPVPTEMPPRVADLVTD